MEQDFKPGDYVYFIDNYDNNYEGEILDVLNPLEHMMVFYSIETRYGTFAVPIYNIFKTKEDREQIGKREKQLELKQTNLELIWSKERI